MYIIHIIYIYIYHRMLKTYNGSSTECINFQATATPKKSVVLDNPIGAVQHIPHPMVDIE